MFFRACYLLLVLNVGIGASLKWTEASLGQDAYITACVGDPVNLTWDFQPPDNDAVQSIYWSFGSNNTIASWLMGSFQTKPPFSGRVKFLAAASLMLDRVSPRDSGMYSVEVRLSEEKNTEHRSAFLAVADFHLSALNWTFGKQTYFVSSFLNLNFRSQQMSGCVCPILILTKPDQTAKSVPVRNSE